MVYRLRLLPLGFTLLLALSIACQTAPTPTVTFTPTTATARATPLATVTLIPTAFLPTNTPTPAATETPPAQTTVSLYFFREGKLSVVHRRIPRTSQIGSATLQALLTGPSEDEQELGFTNAIPRGTQLRKLTITGDQATVDLSSAFTAEATSSGLKQRLAEIVFTLTQFPTIQRVLVTVDSVPIEPQAAGLTAAGAFTRAAFEDVLPAIFVESPAPGDVVPATFRVWGTANVFEATFRLTITDERGALLVDQTVTATSGSGTRGTFETTVPLPASASTTVRIVAFTMSPRDGSPTNRVEIPVRVEARTQ